MKTKMIIIILVLIGIVACDKDDETECQSEDTSMLTQGEWIEQTSNSFKHRLLFEEEIVYFFKEQRTDTFVYNIVNQAVGDQDRIITFKFNQSISESVSIHPFCINTKEKELIIWSLFASLPNNPSKTIFTNK